jgi:hypothetical protein
LLAIGATLQREADQEGKAIKGKKPPPARLLSRIGVTPKLCYELVMVEANQK